MTASSFRNLAGKWLAAAFLLLAVGIGALWYSAISAYEAAVLRERGRELQAIAELKIDFIRFWLSEKRGDAAIPGSAPLMARAAEFGIGRGGMDGAAAVLDRLDAFRKAHGYENVILLDRAGHIRAEIGPQNDLTHARIQDAAHAAMEGGKTLISRAYASRAGGRAHHDIDIATPVISGDKPSPRIVGALVFHLSPQAHLDPLLQKWPSPSESGETILIEHSGDKIVFLSSPRHADAAAMQLNDDNPSLPAALAARGRQGVIEGIDYRGVPVLAAVGRVPDMPWYVVAKLDREEILAPVRRQALWSGSLSALLVLALGLAMFSWQRRGRSELALAQQTVSREALRASEARFRKLIENGWDFHVLFDRDMRIVYSSPSVVNHLGRNLIGENISSGTALVHPEDVAHVEDVRLKALAAPGTPQRVEHRLKGRGQNWLKVEAYFVNQFDDPDIGALTYTGRDITKRLEAELSLRESEARLRAIFESVPVGIAIADRQGHYLMVNPAQCRMLGYSEAELLGRPFAEFTHKEEVQSNLDLAALVRSGTADIASMEKRYVKKDGTLLWVLLTVGLVRNSLGEPLGTVGIVQDITERREAEAARLEFVRQQRDTLVREVHHRIKNHLQGLAGLLNQHKRQHPGQHDALEVVSAQITAISVIHGLQGREASGEVRLFKLLKEIVSFLGSRAALDFGNADNPLCHNCAWRVADEESVPVALIINELVTNAIKHQSRTFDGQPAPVRIGCDCNDERIIVALRNPGALPRGFDFSAGAGLGTGLALVRSLLSHKGAALSIAAGADGMIETRLTLTTPVVSRKSDDQVASLR